MTFTSLIDACMRCKDFTRAGLVLEEMQAANVPVRHDPYRVSRELVDAQRA